MADPKYANLPGLDLEAPDVYETDDRPEVDQFSTDNGPDDVVETLHVTANEAFGKFKNKHLDTSRLDFSDTIRKSRLQGGYVAWSGDLEAVGANSGEPETIVQKYQRLNCEVRELLDEIQKAKEDEGGDSTALGVTSGGKPGQSLAAIAKQTTQLQDTLANLKLEETLGSELIKRLDDPSGSAKEKLLLQLEALKNVKPSSSGKAGQSSSCGGSDNLTYELLMKPETSKLDDQKRIAQLDKRLEHLEKILAYTPENMGELSMETNAKTVTGALGVLSQRMDLLTPGHLDAVEGRLAALTQKMNNIAEAKTKASVLEDAEKQSKISELYDVCVKAEANAVVLPNIVDRLDSLQTLHQQASQFSKALTQLDTVQQKLDSSLGSNQKILMETQAKFSENLSNIQNNFENIEQRLNALQEK